MMACGELDGGEWLTSGTDHFTPEKRAPGNHCVGGWVDLSSDACIKWP